MTNNNPADYGFHMPAEWYPHKCCWMAWPCRDNLWDDYDASCKTYAEVANTIVRFEPLKMLAPKRLISLAARHLSENVELIEMPIDDSWTRDSGPNFLLNEAGELAGSGWRFNAWGEKYQPYDQDAHMASRILRHANAGEFVSELVAEGGGITLDGEGTVITTESCFPNKNRNPGWTQQDIEKELCRTLGAEKVIWIPGDIEETETDGHIDGIAAFIEPGRVLVELNEDKTDPHYEVGQDNLCALKNQRDAKGRKLELEFIYEASYKEDEWNSGCSSYVNSYLANNAVIVPGYDSPRDEAAVEVYKNLYPEREVVQVQINDIAVGGGGVHCITQQQPKV